MAMIDVNWKPDRRQLGQFGWIALVAFGALGALTWYTDKILFWRLSPAAADTTACVLWAVAALSGLFVAAAPKLLLPLYVGLMAVALPIGFVVSHGVLALVYYGLFTPLGLFFRLIGRDALQRRFEPAARTYWVPRRPVTSVKQYYRQF